jgi:hypothetical protein
MACRIGRDRLSIACRSPVDRLSIACGSHGVRTSIARRTASHLARRIAPRVVVC